MPSQPPDNWTPQDPTKLAQTAPWLAYVLPYVVFALLTALEHQFRYVYPLFYTLKIGAVVWVLALVRPRIPELTAKPQGLVVALAAGVVLCALWLIIDKYTPHFKFLGTRTGYDPRALHPDALRWAFTAVRLFGLTVVAPMVEEVLFRGFLLRYVSAPERWQSVPLGAFTVSALAFNVGGMALSHPEWLAAAVFSFAMCLLIRRTRSLWACIVAHGMTNLLLGVYVLTTHDWRYW